MDIAALKNVPNLHHAYIVVGGGVEEILALLKARGVRTEDNPDITLQTYTDLDVDDARDISERASLRAQNGEKFFILNFTRASQGAQNALLKVIEDAPGGSHFFLLVPHIGLLLPTMRSRCIAVTGGAAHSDDALEKARSFIAETVGVRMAIVEKMVLMLQKTHDREPARSLVRALIELVHERRAYTPLRDLLDADRSLESAGSSPKLILNHLALVLPRFR